MTITGLDTFDATLQKTIPWINDLAKELGWENKHQVFQGLRAYFTYSTRSPDSGRSCSFGGPITYSFRWILL